MRFDIKGIEPSHPDVERFRKDWLGLIIEENHLINGPEDSGELSTGQLFIVNLCTGRDGDYRDSAPFKVNEDEHVITMVRPPQAEMEAIFRARNRALANFLSVTTAENATVKPNG